MDRDPLKDIDPDMKERIDSLIGEEPHYILRALDEDGEPVLNELGGIVVQIPRSEGLDIHRSIAEALMDHQATCDGRDNTVTSMMATTDVVDSTGVNICSGGVQAAFEGAIALIEDIAERNGATIEGRELRKHLSDEDSVETETDTETEDTTGEDWTGIDID